MYPKLGFCNIFCNCKSFCDPHATAGCMLCRPCLQTPKVKKLWQCSLWLAKD